MLRREREVMMRREPEKAARSSGGSSGGSSKKPVVELPPEAAPVFERLRAWRAGVAKEQGLPAYVIFHDKTLRQIATQRPATLSALGTVDGVGQAKLERYGEQVLEALASE